MDELLIEQAELAEKNGDALLQRAMDAKTEDRQDFFIRKAEAAYERAKSYRSGI